MKLTTSQLRGIIKEEIFSYLTEQKMSPTQVVKILRSSDFGYTESGGNGEALRKGNDIIIRDSWFYDGDKKLKQMKDNWSPGGFMHDYFKKEHGVGFKIIAARSCVRGCKMYGRKQQDGVNEITLKLI